MDTVHHLNLAQLDTRDQALPQHLVGDGLEADPAVSLAETTLEQTQGAVIWGRFIDRQPNKFLHGQLKVDDFFRLALGQIVDIGDEKHLEDDHRRIRGTAFFGQALVGREQNGNKPLPVNHLVQFDEEIIARDKRE